MSTQQFLWLRDVVEYTLTNGQTLLGYEIRIFREWYKGENIDDLNVDVEFDRWNRSKFTETIRVDLHYNRVDDDLIDDYDLFDVNNQSTFYVGNYKGLPIE